MWWKKVSLSKVVSGIFLLNDTPKDDFECRPLLSQQAMCLEGHWRARGHAVKVTCHMVGKAFSLRGPLSRESLLPRSSFSVPLCSPAWCQGPGQPAGALRRRMEVSGRGRGDTLTCDHQLQGIAGGWPYIGEAAMPAIALVDSWEAEVHRTQSEVPLEFCISVPWQGGPSWPAQWKSVERHVCWTAPEGNILPWHRHLTPIGGEKGFVVQAWKRGEWVVGRISVFSCFPATPFGSMLREGRKLMFSWCKGMGGGNIPFHYYRTHVHVLSHVQLFVTLSTVAPQTPLSMGLSGQQH